MSTFGWFSNAHKATARDSTLITLMGFVFTLFLGFQPAQGFRKMSLPLKTQPVTNDRYY